MRPNYYAWFSLKIKDILVFIVYLSYVNKTATFKINVDVCKGVCDWLLRTLIFYFTSNWLDKQFGFEFGISGNKIFKNTLLDI